MANRIDNAFRKARRQDRAAFMPFITAGDPDIATTGAVIEEIARRGADLIELGIPYSDPIADGPTIQASYVRALGAGLKLDAVFGMVRDVRTRCEVPILTMVSFSIVSRIGYEEYFRRAADAGVDGAIIPDLPADEGRAVSRLASAQGLHSVCLVAPTTHPDRMKQIAKLSKGFIYYVSTTGTTGTRDNLAGDIAQHVAGLRQVTSKPIAVGFGISRPEHVRTIAGFADGAIVGSAIVKKVHELAGRPRDELVSAVGDLVASLAAATSKT